MMQLLRWKSSAASLQVLSSESSGADDGVDAVGRHAGQVLAGRVEHGEVHTDLHPCPGQGICRIGDDYPARIAGRCLADQFGHGRTGPRGVHRGDELHVLRGHNGRAHCAPHAPGGAQNADPDHGVIIQFRRRRGRLGASAGPRSPKSAATIRSNSSAKETSSTPAGVSGSDLSERDP